MAFPLSESGGKPKRAIGLAIVLPLLALALLLALVLTFESSAGRLAIEVGLLISAYSLWAVSSGSFLLDLLKLKDANVELAAIQAAYIVVIFALILIVLGFLNLFGVLPWQ